MNHIRRICHSLTGLQRRVGVLLASSAVPPAVLAADPPLPPPGWHEHPPPLPARTHTVVVGGMPHWQITLITVGAALLAGALAVLVGRARVARRRATADAARTMTASATTPHRSTTG
jgi:hypothetical protein